MFFFSKVQTVAHLSRNSLELLGEKGTKEVLELSKEIQKQGKIIDKEKLKERVVEFLAKSGIPKQKIILVLSQEVLFLKTLPLEDREEIKTKASKFFDEIVSNNGPISKKTLADDKNVYLIAAIKELHQTLSSAFSDMGWKVHAVVPSFKNEDVLQLLNNTSLLALLNFREEEEEEKKDKIPSLETQEGFFGKRFFLIGFFIFIIGSVIGGLLLLKVLTYPQMDTKNITEEKIQLASPLSFTPTPTLAEATPTAKQRADLKVQILNGTGVAGQGAKTKNILKEIGYSNIEVGNADTRTTVTTTIVFSSQVPVLIQKEIQEALEKEFEEVAKEASDSSDFDIAIVTGPYK